MSKILIGLSVPSIEEHFDLFVPVNVPIGQLCVLLADGLKQMTNGYYRSSGSELLCLKDPNRLLSRDMTLGEYGIYNGDQLILY